MRRILRPICLMFATLGAVGGLPTTASAAARLGTGVSLNWHTCDASNSSAREDAARAAAAGVDGARERLHKVSAAIVRQYEASPELQEARAAAVAAQSAYRQAVDNARAAARQMPESRSALVEIDQLEAQLASARAEAIDKGADHTPAIDALATTLLQQRTELSRREQSAIDSDHAITTLRYAWIDANARQSGLEADLSERIRSDGQWRSAKAQLEQSRTSLASITD